MGHHSRPRLVILLLVAFLTTAGTCDKDDGTGTGGKKPTPGRTFLSAPPIELPTGRYVAIGDSYSAGEGVMPYEEGTEDVSDDGDRCHRSKLAYARLLEFTNETEVVFRACSGARVRHVYQEVQTHDGVKSSVGLQVVEGVLGDDVVLVTMSLGGNDMGFADILKICAENSNCLAQPVRFPDGTTRSLEKWSQDRMQQLAPQLADVYTKIKEQAPQARILIHGYPHLFPRTGPNPSDSDFVGCRLTQEAYKENETSGIREISTQFNRTIERTVERSGLEYVDTATFFAGHEPCGAGRDWVNFLHRKGTGFGSGAFHPNHHGHEAFARIIQCYLAETDGAIGGTPPAPAGGPATESMETCVEEAESDG